MTMTDSGIEPTPTFDAVMVEQGHEMMPLPPSETHAEWLARHGHDEWLAKCDRILTEPVPETVPKQKRRTK